MPGVSSPGNFGAYKYGFVPGPGGGGINREDLLDQITNLDPYDIY